MKFHSLYLIVFLIFFVSSCAKEKEKISIVEEESLESQMIKTYNEGLNELDKPVDLMLSLYQKNL